MDVHQEGKDLARSLLFVNKDERTIYQGNDRSAIHKFIQHGRKRKTNVIRTSNQHSEGVGKSQRLSWRIREYRKGASQVCHVFYQLLLKLGSIVDQHRPGHPKPVETTHGKVTRLICSLYSLSRPRLTFVYERLLRRLKEHKMTPLHLISTHLPANLA